MKVNDFIDFGTVGNLNNYIADKIAQHPKLQRIKVKGEISEWKQYGQKVIFLSLKDQDAELKAIIWSRHWRDIKTLSSFREGDEVVACGEINFWSKRGTISLNICHLAPTGLGVLFAQRQQWFNHYQKLGYFKPEQKQSIPRFPRLIGVVTAKNGAAIKDIIQTVCRRYPVASIILFPATVQGETAKTSIQQAVQDANQYSRTSRTIDVLIVGRGGGSIEDLWAFNEPVVIEAIYHSKIPIVTGIGHEIDTSLADLVADATASTPTAAAERVTNVSLVEINTMMGHYHQRLFNLLRQKYVNLKTTFHQYQVTVQTAHWRLRVVRKVNQVLDYQLNKFKSVTNLLFVRIEQKISNYHHRIDFHLNLQMAKWSQCHLTLKAYQERLFRLAQMVFKRRDNEINRLRTNFHHLNPQKLLQKGYSFISNRQHQMITSINHVKMRDEINCELIDGTLVSMVRKKINYKR